jgi:hypothetical protein
MPVIKAVCFSRQTAGEVCDAQHANQTGFFKRYYAKKLSWAAKGTMLAIWKRLAFLPRIAFSLSIRATQIGFFLGAIGSKSKNFHEYPSVFQYAIATLLLL